MIGYGVCVGWWDEFQKYIVPQIGDRRVYGGGEQPNRPLIALSNQESIAVAYNTILNAFWDQQDLGGPKWEAVILLHTDLTVDDPEGEAKLVAAVQEPGVALAGIEGGDGDRGTEWWACNPIGHQYLDTMVIDFAGLIPGAETGPPRTKPRARSGDVDVLEGSILAFSPWAIRYLRFDENCPAAFHGYDEICLQARSAGKRCVVVDVQTHHHTTGAYKGQQSVDDWAAANRWSREKWGKE